MSVQQISSRMVFGPSEIVQLSTAYRTALSSITEESSGSRLSPLELRRQIAVGIIEAAKGGQLDPECLKLAALQSLEDVGAGAAA